jgi:hypothetical protein
MGELMNDDTVAVLRVALRVQPEQLRVDGSSLGLQREPQVVLIRDDSADRAGGV